MFWCVLFAFALGYGSSIDSCMDLDPYLCCTEDNDIYMTYVPDDLWRRCERNET